MTVSRGLRGMPGVSEKLRRQIEDCAKRLGYRPDPVVGKLMHQLRRGGRAGRRASLCAITDVLEKEEPAYCTRIYRHALERAHELGFTLSRLNVAASRGGWAACLRTLTARGVEGVMLLPLREPGSIDGANWDEFSVVAATSSVIAPKFSEIIPNHAANARLMVERLAAKGFRRIGFVGLTTHAVRTRDAYSAALAWHHVQHDQVCRPLFYPDNAPPRIAGWVRRERPEVVIVGYPPDLARFRSEVKRERLSVNWAVANSRPFFDEAAGIDERHDLAGAAAIDMLASLVVRGERGVPRVPVTVSISGEWSEVTEER